jgi:hypothetical protein
MQHNTLVVYQNQTSNEQEQIQTKQNISLTKKIKRAQPIKLRARILNSIAPTLSIMANIPSKSCPVEVSFTVRRATSRSKSGRLASDIHLAKF